MMRVGDQVGQTPKRWWFMRCVLALLCFAVSVVSVSAQDELPGNDPAAWLEEASVQARRITGVGEELTYALQTKGALLAQIAAVQRELGEDPAAEENERIVNLCVRALAHDGEDGWIHASRALHKWYWGHDAEAETYLGKIGNPAEREYVAGLLRDEGDASFERDQMSRGFREQLSRSDLYGWAHFTVLGIAGQGRFEEARDWTQRIDDPAQRAWASLGVAQGLLEAAKRPEPEPTITAEAPAILPDAEPEPAPGSLVATEPESPVSLETIDAESTEPAADLAAAPEAADTVAVTEAPLPVVEAEPASTPEVVERVAEPVEVSAAPNATEPVRVVVVPAAIPVAEVDAEESESSEPETAAVAEPVAEAQPDEDALVAEVSESTPSVEPAPVEASAESVPAVVVDEVPAPTDEGDEAVAMIPVVPDLKRLAEPASVLDDQPAPDQYDLDFVTTQGTFVVRVHRDWAPLAADRFYDLSVAGFYHNQRVFRVVDGFVVQWGIHGYPDVAAAWRPQKLKDEPRTQSNQRGTITFAAATQPNTRATQVFINLDDNQFLDDLGFAPFGEVIEGMDVVESLFKDYGETPSTKQREIQLQGNAYLDAAYPELDSILSVEHPE
ncbi:peptidylprolyl isomerase [Algisphaera agarilytica]|nr:peptidylprolyl isomerase [Algisphaera agarilytica]